MDLNRIKREKTLWEMSDEELNAVHLDALQREKMVRQLAFECGFHKMLRKNVKREHLKDKVRDLTKQLEALS